MMPVMSLLMLACAAICNAVMDTVIHHWDTFRWKDSVKAQWWNANISWRNKYIDGDPKKGRREWSIIGLSIPIPVQFTDAWHFFKSLMVIFLCLACVIFPASFQICIFNSYLLNGILWVAILGFTWNVPFSLFYNRILVKKP